MATCFGHSLDHLQATYLGKGHNQCVLRTVGSFTTNVTKMLKKKTSTGTLE